MLRLRFLRSALADLEEISAYIARENPEAAGRIIRDLVDRVGLLASYPDAGEGQPHLGIGIRKLTERPYVVFYCREGDEIAVVRVLHGARRITRALLRDP